MPRSAKTSGEPATEVRTFLFADVRGYTRFTHEHGDEAAATLISKLVSIAQRCVEAHAGKVVEVRGDEVMAAFSSARQALRSAVELQASLQVETRREPSFPLTVGIGIDAGDAVIFGSGYRGGALNLAARLCSLAGPGEVLATEAVIHLARKTAGLRYAERGLVQLKGFADPVPVIEVTREVNVAPPASPELTAQQPAPIAPAERNSGGGLPLGGFIGALPEGVLVARDAEFAAILQSLDEVSLGAGRLVLLAGEAGIGKTRLAQEASLAARNRDFMVVTGRCYESDSAVPFFPFIEALGMAFAQAPTTLQSQVEHRWPGLGRLLPTAWEGAGSGSSEGDEEQPRLFWAVVGFLQAIANDRPIALFLDDIHWSDSSSLKLLQHLARHSRAQRVFLFATYRDVEVDRAHPLDRALLDLHRERLLTRIHLGRLNRDGSAAFIASTLGTEQSVEAIVDLVHPHTDGNPFFIQEVLRALVEQGDIYHDDGHWYRRDSVDIAVPENVRAVIRQRLTHLSSDGQDILHEASVIGQTFGFTHVQLLESRSEEAVELALDEAVGAGLIREMGADEYGFNHTLTHATLYADLAAHKRRRLHLRAAEMLRQSDDPISNRRISEVAWHFLEAGDTAQALPYILLAGDGAAAIFAHAEAEYRYRTAAEFAVEVQDDEREREALEKLGGVLRMRASYEEAFAVLDRAAQLYHGAGDRGGEGRVTAQIGLVHHVTGNPAQGIERITRFLSMPTDTDELLQHSGPTLYVGLASLHMMKGNYADGLTASIRAWEMALAMKNDRVLAEAGVVRGTALILLGKSDDALLVLEETKFRAQTADDAETLSLCLDAMSEIYMLRGEFVRCRTDRTQALALFERMGDPAKIAYGLCILGSIQFYLGNWIEAHVLFTSAMGHMERTESSWVRAYPFIGLGMYNLGVGDIVVARRHFQTCIEISEQSGSPETLTYGQRLMADCDLAEGEPAGAMRRLEPLLHLSGLARDTAPRVLSALAQARLELGDMDGAIVAIDDAQGLAKGSAGRLAMVDVLRVRGLIAVRQTSWDEAEEAYSASALLASSMPLPYAEACAHRANGQLSLLQGKFEPAARHFHAALSIFTALGAQRDITLTNDANRSHH